jgi:hypothetical protein
LTASRPARAELGDRRPGLLGRALEPCGRERVDEPVAVGTAPDGALESIRSSRGRAQLGEPRLGLLRRAAGA